MESTLNFMSMFNIFIAAYVLYYAIKGSGKVYENDYPKEMKAEHAKILRIFCWVVGVGMMPLAILEYKDGFNSIWTTISIFFVLGCIAVYVVIFRKKFGKYLKKPAKKNQKINQKNPGSKK